MQAADDPSHTYGEQVGLPAPEMFVHVPSVPGLAHELHGPEQDELQQTPSTQRLLAHCDASVHGSPSISFEVHAPFAQVFTPHDVVPPGTQVPAPLQVSALSTVVAS